MSLLLVLATCVFKLHKNFIKAVTQKKMLMRRRRNVNNGATLENIGGDIRVIIYQMKEEEPN